MTAPALLAPLDPILAAAVDLARSAAKAEADGRAVGEHVDCHPLPESGPDAPVVVHRFRSAAPAYSGWYWSVSLTRLSDDERVTIDEVALEPGPGALLPPAWVPWRERLRPDDLGVGDRLPAEADDARLVPAYTASGDPAQDDVAFELGLGRIRVMSRPGRVDAAARWYEGDTGPDAPAAKQAPGRCGTCGFYLVLAGSLQAVLGVCGNEYAPSDGRAVAVEFGCGAHSEAVPQTDPEPPRTVSYDTADYDVLSVGTPPAAEQPADEGPAEPLVVDEAPAELGSEADDDEPVAADADPAEAAPEDTARPDRDAVVTSGSEATEPPPAESS